MTTVARPTPAEQERARRQPRQRRPTGAPPPLPRTIGRSGKLWLALVVWLLVVNVLWAHSAPLMRFGDHLDTWMLRLVAHLRVGWLTPVAQALKAAGSGWFVTGAMFGVIAAAAVFRRWRHLLVFLGAAGVITLVVSPLYDWSSRPRPYGIAIIGGWGGFSMPSGPVLLLALPLIGAAYILVVPGRPRWFAKLGIVAALGVFIGSRLYLAVDHPSDAFFGAILGIAIPVTMFRVFAPNEIFPVTYRRGKAAHLDVTGKRGDAIRSGIQAQLGLIVLEIKPVGLEGSGGSTPLRLKVAGDPETYLFAKLYARSNVRADRWYKLWRTAWSGSLEDEAPFKTVRRFVEYEDHLLRLMRDIGVHVPTPYGIVELTPEYEYMIVMEFFEGAVEIGEATVDEVVIDEGLRLVRKLWDAGLAHRDIKPSNLMVRDDEVLLIDVFFAQVRPSPWRQAVDLGNMCLVLALRSDPDRVYERALQFFTPEEMAEAFAATRGLASPSQLVKYIERDGRDLRARFRELAPPRPEIRSWRFDRRRVAVVSMALLLGAVALLGAVGSFHPVQNPPVNMSPGCSKPNDALVLMAQAVPSAASIPCIETLPSGWAFGGADVHDGLARFWLSSDRAGHRAVTVTLQRSCQVRSAVPAPSDEVEATSRFEQAISLTPRFVAIRTYGFPGGCVTYGFAFEAGAPRTLLFGADAALSFVPRSLLVDHIRTREGLALCGRGARCPG